MFKFVLVQSEEFNIFQVSNTHCTCNVLGLLQVLCASHTSYLNSVLTMNLESKVQQVKKKKKTKQQQQQQQNGNTPNLNTPNRCPLEKKLYTYMCCFQVNHHKLYE